MTISNQVDRWMAIIIEFDLVLVSLWPHVSPILSLALLWYPRSFHQACYSSHHLTHYCLSMSFHQFHFRLLQLFWLGNNQWTWRLIWLDNISWSQTHHHRYRPLHYARQSSSLLALCHPWRDSPNRHQWQPSPEWSAKSPLGRYPTKWRTAQRSPRCLQSVTTYGCRPCCFPVWGGL